MIQACHNLGHQKSAYPYEDIPSLPQRNSPASTKGKDKPIMTNGNESIDKAELDEPNSTHSTLEPSENKTQIQN